MADLPEFQARQYEFAAFLRDPDNQPAPTDIETRRMTVYRDLFFNNVRNLLANTFPVLFELLGKERWALLVRDFYRDHKSRSPLFPDLPREFLHYLAEERPNGIQSDELADPPFLYELAHYEWVEAGLLFAADQPPNTNINPEGDLLEGCPVSSHVAWLLMYTWPVNKIGKTFQPEEPSEQPLYYLLYRDSNDKVVFLTLNATSARLFEIIAGDHRQSGQNILVQLAEELQHPNADKVIGSGLKILTDWRKRGIILGTYV